MSGAGGTRSIEGAAATLGVYRFDGTLEWSSVEGRRPVERFDAVREALAHDVHAEVPGLGVTAHRLTSARARGRERCLVVARTRSPRPEWLREVRLTPRQRQVAELASFGATVNEIAAHFEISPHTVRQHLKHVYRALGVGNRVELVRTLGELQLV
ncbi:MAG TPA: helix-turn-helix transcriptional regulator [Sandaracinaceae bacterium LLY-WYZ-13_1]|nr:helix-turn-helix transcriptional regulator [Sandaracinaceae bacterium LLY-WYZ-13_1]